MDSFFIVSTSFYNAPLHSVLSFTVKMRIHFLNQVYHRHTANKLIKWKELIKISAVAAWIMCSNAESRKIGSPVGKAGLPLFDLCFPSAAGMLIRGGR